MGDGLEASAWCEVTAPACDIGIPINDLILSSGPDWTKSRTEADSDVTPSDGMGIVYVSTASFSMISMPCTKLRMRAFRYLAVGSRQLWPVK